MRLMGVLVSPDSCQWLRSPMNSRRFNPIGKRIDGEKGGEAGNGRQRKTTAVKSWRRQAEERVSLPLVFFWTFSFLLREF